MWNQSSWCYFDALCGCQMLVQKGISQGIYIYTSPGQAVACKYGRREVDSSFGLQDCKARNHMRTKRKTCVLFGPQFGRITSALVICILSLPAFLGHIWWTHHCSLLNITVFFACTPDQTFSGCAQFLLFVSALGLAKEPHCCWLLNWRLRFPNSAA